jgi:hypothetical protein
MESRSTLLIRDQPIPGWMTHEKQRELLPQLALGRLGQPEDAARLVVFLAARRRTGLPVRPFDPEAVLVAVRARWFRARQPKSHPKALERIPTSSIVPYAYGTGLFQITLA